MKRPHQPQSSVGYRNVRKRDGMSACSGTGQGKKSGGTARNGKSASALFRVRDAIKRLNTLREY